MPILALLKVNGPVLTRYNSKSVNSDKTKTVTATVDCEINCLHSFQACSGSAPTERGCSSV